jgi:hypothetical protein
MSPKHIHAPSCPAVSFKLPPNLGSLKCIALIQCPHKQCLVVALAEVTVSISASFGSSLAFGADLSNDATQPAQDKLHFGLG